MNRIIILIISCIFFLFASQFFLIYNMYIDFKEKKEVEIKELLYATLDNEINIRVSNKPHKNLSDLSIKVKRAKDMTSEERARLKGDTINLDEAMKKNIGRGFSEVFTQAVQDIIAPNRPINMSVLDTLYYFSLEKNKISHSFRIILFNKDKHPIDTISHEFKKNRPILQTGLLPIGIRGEQFIQAEVAMPQYLIFQHLKYAFIVSILICLLVCYCIYMQFKQIKSARQELNEREFSFYGIVHDLKKPLNHIYVLIDLLQSDKQYMNSTKLPLNIFQNSKQQIKYLSETIESLLNQHFNNIQKKQQKRDKINLPLLIEEQFNDVLTHYPHKKVSFQIKNDQSITMLISDSVRLRRCLCNLFDNALSYSDDQVKITIELKSDSKGCHIKISDTGWGIPKKELTHIGNAFHRYIHPGKPIQFGYGIGLSNVQRLVKEIDGSFFIESTEGKGSSFILILPYKTI